MSGDAHNVDVLTADTLELESGQTYRVSLEIGGGILLGPTVTAIAAVVDQMTERGFASVQTWTEAQYSDLPDDWPRALDPAGSVFPDWTLRVQGVWIGPAVTFNRDLSDVATGTKLTIRHAWRYVAQGGAVVPVPPSPVVPSSPSAIPVIVAGVLVALATATLVAISLMPSKPRRRRRRPSGDE